MVHELLPLKYPLSRKSYGNKGALFDSRMLQSKKNASVAPWSTQP
jgi:hypothetical protein